jgi:hypothetical protein
VRTFSVYLITCNIDNRKYVGMTSQCVKKRISNGKKYTGLLGQAVSTYGWENFSYEVIKDGLSLNEAKSLERKLISDLNTTNHLLGFNQTSGGECMFVGHKQTEDTRKKISNSMKHRKFSDEHRRRISQSKSGTNHHCAKPVYQYDKDGNLVKVWSYMSEASKALGIDKSCISACCRGKTRSSGGYIWSYSPIGGTNDTDV